MGGGLKWIDVRQLVETANENTYTYVHMPMCLCRISQAMLDMHASESTVSQWQLVLDGITRRLYWEPG